MEVEEYHIMIVINILVVFEICLLGLHRIIKSGINIAVGHRPKSYHFHELADHFRFRSAVTSDHI